MATDFKTIDERNCLKCAESVMGSCTFHALANVARERLAMKGHIPADELGTLGLLGDIADRAQPHEVIDALEALIVEAQGRMLVAVEETNKRIADLRVELEALLKKHEAGE